MAIEKSNCKASRFDSEISRGSGETMSSDEGELLQRRASAANVDSEDDDDDDEFDDADSGAGSDDFDLLELAETGAEFCQVENMTCSIPFELYDLPGLEDILSVEVWNECLSEEERFSLTKYLPDVDHLTFMRTLKELFEGSNFHFGSPIKKLFGMLKGGRCEPRNALYLEGRNLFQRTKYYHMLRKYHNGMVVNLCQIRDAWTNCRGYGIDEKLRVLNIMKSQKNLMYEKMEDFEEDSSEKEEQFDGPWSRKVKDRKLVQKKSARRSSCVVDSGLEFSSRCRPIGLGQDRYGKGNSQGMLKTMGSKFPLFASTYNGLDVSSGPSSTSSLLRRQKYGSGLALGSEDHMTVDDDVEDPLFGMRSRRDRDIVVSVKSGLSRRGKKHDFLREELASEDIRGLPYASYLPHMVLPKLGKYADNIQPCAFGDQMKPLKEQSLQPPVKGSLADLSYHADLYRRGKNNPMDPTFVSDDRNDRRKKHKVGRESADISSRSYRASVQQMNERFLNSDFGEKLAQGKIRANMIPNGRSDRAAFRGRGMYMTNDDTESDSSEGYVKEDDSNSVMWNRPAILGGGINSSRSLLLKSGRDDKNSKYGKKDLQETEWTLDGRGDYSKNMGAPGEHIYISRAEKHSSNAKQKGKVRDSSPLQKFASRDFEDSLISGLHKFKDEGDRNEIFGSSKNSQVSGELTDRLQRTSMKPNLAERKRKVFDEDGDALELRSLVNDGTRGRLGRKYQVSEANVNGRGEKSDARLLGPGSAISKKKRAKEFLMDMERRDKTGNSQVEPQQPDDDFTSSKKKGKKKLEVHASSPDMGTSDMPKAGIGAIDVEVETKPLKKPFVLITPTVHTGFSFSIIHLLSAVRMAMISARPEDALDIGRQQNGEPEVGKNGVPVSEEVDTNKSHHPAHGNFPSLSVQEIVSSLRSNPGDPCILETQEPLQDLVRGVLKIFSSKTSPLGAKGWKPLVAYEKSTKSWSWIGPVPHSSSDHETAEEVTSPEAWGLPHKMLVKLVDSFANWLKNGQETLQLIGSLPEPPISLMQCNLDEKERFKDLRAQKSLNTINPSSDEARAYFRKEEVLRYSIPDRAFAYTAADGRKSIVAPLRRGGGKPTSKARDHFMLKRDRPPHVTILCLVRDAAARLPGSIGTRADVCTLIRDSQYIVEDVTDAQVNQVVSGALDRLHYERDPCVQFDAERKLWVYLHREREEEDFEDDGTSSTKKWKRPKKEAAEQSDQGAVTVAFHGNDEQPGADMGSDLNTEPAGADEDKGTDLLCNEVEPTTEDDAENMRQGDETTEQDRVGSNPVEDNTFLCQENSADDDFDDET